MEESKLSDSVFLQWDVRSSVLKTQKNTKTRQTKTPVTQFFQIIRPIQGCTMSKSMPGAFQKCRTYGGGDDLTLSYGPPKSTQISILFEAEMRCLKTSSQAPSYARRLQSETTTDSLTYSQG